MSSTAESPAQDNNSLRGSRARKRGNPSDRPASPRKKSPPPTSSKEEERPRPIRGATNASRGARTSRPRGGLRVMRRGNRPRRANFRGRRLERAQYAARYPRGMRRRFRPRFGYRRPFRRFFGSRSIFIKNLPQRMNEGQLMGMMRREGRVLRLTLLKDNKGESRGMAFAEFQFPRDALKVVQNYRGRIIDGNNIFVAFKRNINRFRYNNPRFGNYRQFGNFRPRFNPNRFQRPMGPMRNGRGRFRGRGRGRGRGF